MTTTDGLAVTSAAAPAEAAVASAERRVHAAERWLRATRQSGIDEWVAGALALLHEAMDEYVRLGGTWSQPYLP